MIDQINDEQLLNALMQSIYLLITSALISLPIGTMLGFLFAVNGKNKLMDIPLIKYVLSPLISIIRSVPFILLMVLIVPLSFQIFRTSYGFIPSFLSLSIIGIATVSRLVEQAIIDINPDLYKIAKAMGATKFQTLIYFLFKEAKASLILGYTSSLISLLAYSSVVYVIGGGGLGHTAIVEGYQHPYGNSMMWASTILMIILVQLIQILGSLLANKLDKKKRESI